MSDWRDVDMGRSRAADRAPRPAAEPVRVVQTSIEGDAPSGDSTMWGGEVVSRVHVSSDDGNPVPILTDQVTRAQVTDNRGRVLSWLAQLSFRVIPDGPEWSLGIIDEPHLLWNMGSGRTSITAREDLTTILVSSAEFWPPVLEPTNIVFTLRPGIVSMGILLDVPTIVDPRPLGEAVGCRFGMTVGGGGTHGFTLETRFSMLMTPEHATP
jgi:hypothetical protein